jgi:hypothetical protein
MRKTVSIVCLLALLLGVWVGGALAAYTFPDVTLIQPWTLGGPTGAAWTDVVGNTSTYDTFGANLSGSTLTIFTNWNPNKDGLDDPAVITADLFIDKNNTGTWNYAIHLDTAMQGATTKTFNASVYLNPSYYTSNDIFKGAQYAGDSYGGKFDQANPRLVPTEVVNSSSFGTTPVTWTLGTGGLNNQVAIDLTSLNLTGSKWSFVWGTSTCGNDALTGTAVPLPAPFLLLGAGLLRLAGVLRRQKGTS